MTEKKAKGYYNIFVINRNGAVKPVKITLLQLKIFIILFVILLFLSIILGVGYFIKFHEKRVADISLLRTENMFENTQKIISVLKTKSQEMDEQLSNDNNDLTFWQRILIPDNIINLNNKNEIMELTDLTTDFENFSGKLNIRFKVNNKKSNVILRGSFVFFGITKSMIVVYPDIINFPDNKDIVETAKGEPFSIRYFKTVKFKVPWDSYQGSPNKAYLLFYDNQGILIYINVINMI